MERATHPVGGDSTLIDRVQDGISRWKGGETINKNPKIQDPTDQRRSGKKVGKRQEERGVGIEK